MAILIDILAAGVVDAVGAPLANGLAYFYAIGTTTKTTAYQDSDLTVPYANPLTLDAAGRAEVYVNDPVRLILEDSDGNQIEDIASIGEVAALTGDVTIGTNSANELRLNSRIRGDLIPRLPGVYDVGSATYPWVMLCLDNGATDAGAIYFDAGTTKFIKANAAGTIIEVRGFTYVELDDGTYYVQISTSEDGGLRVDGVGSGDASLDLRVNADDANAWTVRNDNSDSDNLSLEYGGVVKAVIRSDGGIEVTGDDASAPRANVLYQANVTKAWASLLTAAGGAVTVEDDHNVSSASWADNNLTVSWDTDFANDTYAIAALPSLDFVDNTVVALGTRAVGTCVIEKMDSAGGVAGYWEAGETVVVIGIGDQS